MNITGTETIETEDGKIEVECDDEGLRLTVYERHLTGNGIPIGWRSTAYVPLTFAEWTAVNRAVETFAAALNRKNAA